MITGHPLPGALGDDEEHRVDGGGAGRHLPAAGAHGQRTGGDGTEVSNWGHLLQCPEADFSEWQKSLRRPCFSKTSVLTLFVII